MLEDILKMYNGKKIVVVMPAYNAEKTLIKTYNSVMAQKIVDCVVIVDDFSTDNTVEVAGNLPNSVFFKLDKNYGYGGNQKKCYQLALENGADIVIMVHPDYQYTPKLIPAMVSMLSNGLYHCVLGSRILGCSALEGGMPLYKYAANRFLTFVENIMLGTKLSEYHTGYRAFTRELLEQLDIEHYSDDFVFDNQMLAQIIWTGTNIAEVTCPTAYFAEASSINFKRSVIYGAGCLTTALRFVAAKYFSHKDVIFCRDKFKCLINTDADVSS